MALVVMSVGMLGIASLYVTSLQAGRTALTRTQAVNLVNDMADRIRANSRGRGAYALADTRAADAQAPTSTPPCITSLNCAPETLAAIDLNTWLRSFKTALPRNARATVTYAPPVAGDPDKYQIRVNWSESGQDNSYFVRLQLIPVRP